MSTSRLNPKLFAELEARGIVKQVTDPELGKTLSSEALTLYCGFDPTSDSLHIGSLLPLLTLRRFQQAGHRVIALVGGATGMIGDPSFKTQERKLLDPATLAKNQAGITQVISRFLELAGPNPAKITNNYAWFRELGYIEFLRDVGKHFTINHMMAKESVRARLEDREHGISYTEFSYMLLQAYDFYILNREDGCRLQIGGSDQWGNITAGIELIRKMGGAEKPVYGMTHPLVTKADGTKFGKTESGAIWLDAKRTSPYEFYQYLIQTSDADVITYLNYFSFLPLEEIRRLAEATRVEPEKREAQKALARHLTELVHGAEELAKVEKAAQALFGTEIRELDAKTLRDALSNAPSSKKSRGEIARGLPLVDLLAETGLCNSKGAARKEISSGGIYVNNERVTDPAAQIGIKDLIAEESCLVLRRGKKTYHLVSVD